MPYGISWTSYFRFCTAASIATFLGSQVVHNYYKPLDDLDKLVQEELEKRRKEKLAVRDQNIAKEKDNYN